MIVKMKFVTISGPLGDIDRITDQYLSKHEIHLESALSELKTVENLQPITDSNPYRNILSLTEQFVKLIDKPDQITSDSNLDVESIRTLIRQTNTDYLNLKEKKDSLNREQNAILARMNAIAPFRSIEYDMKDILSYQYINYRFGRLPIYFYGKLQKYLLDDLSAIFIEGGRDEAYQYGVYFVSARDTQKTDATFRSLHFERTPFDMDLTGTPASIYAQLQKQSDELSAQISDLEDQISNLISSRGPQILAANKKLEVLANNFDIRKYAARMVNDQSDYYVLCGWMSETDITELLKDTKDDDNVIIVLEKDHKSHFGEPPTKLKNPKIFKPYEMYVGMYGLPAHDELDPTVFVALTYSFIFGMMFGDVGQGLVLAIGGFLLYKFKHMALAGIISMAGIFSTFFGFMFGSVFGFENVIEAVWLHPMSHMTTLPFIGRLNTVFVVTIAFGMGLILFAMILHIINGVKSHDIGSTWFDVNGVAGLVFYGSLVLTIVLFMTGKPVPAGIVMVIMFGIPLLVIVFKEPLTNLIMKKAEIMEESIGMFLVQGVFELIETLLSYFSNTLSFVRIGAFAVSHAAMMEVVLMLAGATEGGNPNWLVVVLGNIFVCGMEGLVVGIQVLRLEYYEMFSRFYKGSGREFKPYKRNSN